MVDIEVRQLGDRVAAALKERARRRGISLEEEVRRTLAASVAADRAASIRRAAAVRAAIAERRGGPTSDSAAIIREERDAWG